MSGTPSPAATAGLSPFVLPPANAKWADLYKALGPDKPAIGILPFGRGTGVAPALASFAENEASKYIILNYGMRPYAITEWLTSAYDGSKKASSVQDLIDAIKAAYLPLQNLLTGRIMRCGDSYVIRLDLYSFANPEAPDMAMRFFESPNACARSLVECLAELASRNAPSKNANKTRTFFVNRFKLSFYRYSELQSGDFAFSETPFLQKDTIDIRPSDEFLSELIAYNLNSTRMAQATVQDGERFVDVSMASKRSAKYIVDGQLAITDKLCLATIILRTANSEAAPRVIRVPFASVNATELFGLARGLSSMLLSCGSSDEDLRSMGKAGGSAEAVITSSEGAAPAKAKGSSTVASTTTASTTSAKKIETEDLDYFCEGYYVGKSLADLLVPVGLNTVCGVSSSAPPAVRLEAMKRSLSSDLILPGVSDGYVAFGVVAYPFSNPAFLQSLQDCRYFSSLMAAGKDSGGSK